MSSDQLCQPFHSLEICSWADEDSCRINELPDPILHHLLSFLPTKLSVATSILSKRWRYLWTEVPALDFEDKPDREADENHRKAFEKFVDGVLRLNKQVSLQKFRFNCHPNYSNKDYSSFHTWIDEVIRRGIVEEVDISISPYLHRSYKLTRIYHPMIKNLKVLKLSYGILIEDCTSICFPSLKILHLKLIDYRNDQSVPSLLRGCSSLEVLVINRSSVFDNVGNFIISVPTLKTLSYVTNQGYREYYITRLGIYQLTINAPALEYLNIQDDGRKITLCFESPFIRLIQANISFQGTCLFQVVKAVCNARFLSLKLDDSELDEASLKYESFPLFHNLTRLELCRFIAMTDYYDLDVVQRFLENSPNLQFLNINMESLWRAAKVSEAEKEERVPKYLSPNLTKIYLRKTTNRPWLEMVEYMLKNATVPIFYTEGVCIVSKMFPFHTLCEL